MIPYQLLLTMSVTGVVVLMTLYALLTQEVAVLYAIAALPPVIYLMTRPDILLVCVIALFASFLTFPGFPTRLNLFLVFALLLTCAVAAIRLMRGPGERLTVSRKFALGLGVVLLLTACVRGFGLRFGGGETWGGGAYAQLLIAVGFLIVVRSVELTPRQWKVGLYGMCVLSAVPTAAALLVVLSRGSIYQQLYFVTSEAMEYRFFLGMQERPDMARLQIANVTSAYLFTLAFLLYKDEKRSKFWVLGCAAASFVLIGVSGHRIAVVYCSLLALGFAFVASERAILARLVNPFTVGVLSALTILAFLAPHLPFTFQRAISWIPFAEVSPEARMAAQGTITWRLEVWKLALKEIPQYLWLGKGFAFSSKDIFSVNRNPMSSMEYVLTSRNYHNGVLAILLDLGLPGLLTSAGFVFFAAREQWKNLKLEWNDTLLRHFHRVILAAFLANGVVYLVLAGGPTTLVQLFLLYVILEGLARTDQKAGARARQQGVPVPGPSLASNPQA